MKKEIGELTMKAEDRMPTIERKINLVYEKLLDIDYQLQAQNREKKLKELELEKKLIEEKISDSKISDFLSYDRQREEEKRFEGRY